MPESFPALPLHTRANWQIPNEVRPERPKPALEASVELFKDMYPDAIPRSVTAVYNCIGMVVATRRTWVDPEHLMKILQDDGYWRLAGPADTEPGDLVTYHDENGEVCHVGLVLRKNLAVPNASIDPVKVLSKWGADGEYIHDMSYVPPILGTPAEFWTDRRVF